MTTIQSQKPPMILSKYATRSKDSKNKCHKRKYLSQIKKMTILQNAYSLRDVFIVGISKCFYAFYLHEICIQSLTDVFWSTKHPESLQLLPPASISVWWGGLVSTGCPMPNAFCPNCLPFPPVAGASRCCSRGVSFWSPAKTMGRNGRVGALCKDVP